MANALVLETLSLKELGALGSSVRLKYWQHLRKGDLLERLSALNRDFTQADLDAASVALARKQAARAARVKAAQTPPSLDLSASSSNDSSEEASRVLKKSPATETSEKNRERVPNKSDQIRTTESKNESSSVLEPGASKASSETKISLKNNKKTDRRPALSEAPRATVAESIPGESQSESPSRESENVLSETRDARSKTEKVVCVAERVVPILAERLAKRLAECLTKELALGSDETAAPCSGVGADSCVEDVASKLVETIIPSSPNASADADDSSTRDDASKQDGAVRAGIQNVDGSNANGSKATSEEEEDDDAVIETILPNAGASRNARKRPSDGSPSLKDKLRLKKFIGSPDDKVDRLVLMVCDPYWIRACWEVTTQLVERVRSAMSRHWHTADPVLRLYCVDPATSRREFVKDVEINGGVSNWYVPVENPPSTFAVELGYKSRDGQFFTLLSSNAVQTPKQFVRDADGRPCTESFNAPFNFQTGSHDRWTQKSRQTKAERRSSFDERPKKPFAPSDSAVGTALSTHEGFLAPSSFLFQADAEVLFTGRVSNGATVKVKEEPVCQASDGSFSIRFSLPERRHVFPIVATSVDENETQTIIVAIERNTKTLDPVFKEDDEE